MLTPSIGVSRKSMPHQILAASRAYAQRIFRYLSISDIYVHLLVNSAPSAVQVKLSCESKMTSR